MQWLLYLVWLVTHIGGTAPTQPRDRVQLFFCPHLTDTNGPEQPLDELPVSLKHWRPWGDNRGPRLYQGGGVRHGTDHSCLWRKILNKKQQG